MFETVLNNTNSHFDEFYSPTFPTSPLFNKPLPTLQLS